MILQCLQTVYHNEGIHSENVQFWFQLRNSRTLQVQISPGGQV
jgi:hypothetical protein